MTTAERNQVYAKILSKMIAKETVSHVEETDFTRFYAFHQLVKELFPSFCAVAEWEDFNGSFLLRWKGKDAAKKPILLMSHHDVVEATGEWKYPAFSGEIAEGKVWGRGTLDTKGNLFAILQAVEELAADGFVPSRDVYVYSGCNEETTGAGACAASKALAERGIRLFMTVDEGGMIVDPPMVGVDGAFAMVGVGEKAWVDLKFTARSGGGHASTPGKNTPLVRLGKFMAEADRAKIFQVELSPVVKEMLTGMAPRMKGLMRFLCSHVSLFGGFLKRVMPGVSPNAAAMLRTTLAFTMAQGSGGRNVLPEEAFVIGNMRVSHHQGLEKSIGAVKELAAKYGVETEVLTPGFASGLTDFNGEGFAAVKRAIAHVFPELPAVPYVMTAATDSRYFDKVSDNCLRFAPFTVGTKQLATIHGVNESVNVETLAPAVDFYLYLLKEN